MVALTQLATCIFYKELKMAVFKVLKSAKKKQTKAIKTI